MTAKSAKEYSAKLCSTEIFIPGGCRILIASRPPGIKITFPSFVRPERFQAPEAMQFAQFAFQSFRNDVDIRMNSYILSKNTQGLQFQKSRGIRPLAITIQGVEVLLITCYTGPLDCSNPGFYYPRNTLIRIEPESRLL